MILAYLFYPKKVSESHKDLQFPNLMVTTVSRGSSCLFYAYTTFQHDVIRFSMLSESSIKLHMCTHKIFLSRTNNVLFEPVNPWEENWDVYIILVYRHTHRQAGWLLRILMTLKTFKHSSWLLKLYWQWKPWSLKTETDCIGESQTINGVSGFLGLSAEHRGHIWAVATVAAPVPVSCCAGHEWHTVLSTVGGHRKNPPHIDQALQKHFSIAEGKKVSMWIRGSKNSCSCPRRKELALVDGSASSWFLYCPWKYFTEQFFSQSIQVPSLYSKENKKEERKFKNSKCMYSCCFSLSCRYVF